MEEGKRVVILGAGFGGLVTAIRLSKTLPVCHEIVLVDKEDVHVYTPWLYDIATSFLFDQSRTSVPSLPSACMLPVKTIFEQRHDKRLRFKRAEVIGVDAEKKQVLFSQGQPLAYDVLVIAVGSETTYYGIPGMEEYAFPMKRLGDAMDVREAISRAMNMAVKDGKAQKTIAIVGAGATGSEMAAELMNYVKRCEKNGIAVRDRVRVLLFDAGPHALGQFSAFIQLMAGKRFVDLGVELRTNTPITRVDRSFLYTKETKIPYDVLVWAGGIQPRPLLAMLPFMHDDRGRLLVQNHLLITGEHHVFALGDAAVFVDAATKKPVPPTAWAAVDQTHIVAKNVRALLSERDFVAYHPPAVYPAVIALGGKHAAGGAYGLQLTGFIGFLLRRFVDVRYFLKILPPVAAVRFAWRATFTLSNND